MRRRRNWPILRAPGYHIAQILLVRIIDCGLYMGRPVLSSKANPCRPARRRNGDAARVPGILTRWAAPDVTGRARGVLGFIVNGWAGDA